MVCRDVYHYNLQCIFGNNQLWQLLQFFHTAFGLDGRRLTTCWSSMLWFSLIPNCPFIAWWLNKMEKELIYIHWAQFGKLCLISPNTQIWEQPQWTLNLFCSSNNQRDELVNQAKCPNVVHSFPEAKFVIVPDLLKADLAERDEQFLIFNKVLTAEKFWL